MAVVKGDTPAEGSIPKLKKRKALGKKEKRRRLRRRGHRGNQK
jgi:hypothetical protein